MAYSKVPKTQFGGHLVAQPRLLVHTNARNVRAKFKTITETASVVLAPDEQRSLEAVIKAKGLQHLIGANGSSTSSTSANTVPLQLPDGVSKQLLTTIKMGVQKEVEDLQQLEGAMLLAEQLHYAGSSSGAGTQQGSLSPVNNVLVSSVSPQSVDIWQPIFASSGGFPRLLYIPVPEYFDMHRALPDSTPISAGNIDVNNASSTTAVVNQSHTEGAVNIITVLGPFTTHFLGTCQWLTDTDFEYKIKKIRVDFGGRSLTIPIPVKFENVLTFFLVTPELACARSKLGGTMLLEANPSKGKKYFTTW
eukprot:GHRR01005025.1.p1 GENE.GHRR01005025.1~~GHRR01005025.1.p1  ORF type:complete len:306 (+),score=95.72 GHRR01005025.1:226-1143(+)